MERGEGCGSQPVALQRPRSLPRIPGHGQNVSPCEQFPARHFKLGPQQRREWVELLGLGTPPEPDWVLGDLWWHRKLQYVSTWAVKKKFLSPVVAGNNGICTQSNRDRWNGVFQPLSCSPNDWCEYYPGDAVYCMQYDPSTDTATTRADLQPGSTITWARVSLRHDNYYCKIKSSGSQKEIVCTCAPGNNSCSGHGMCANDKPVPALGVSHTCDCDAGYAHTQSSSLVCIACESGKSKGLRFSSTSPGGLTPRIRLQNMYPTLGSNITCPGPVYLNYYGPYSGCPQTILKARVGGTKNDDPYLSGFVFEIPSSINIPSPGLLGDGAIVHIKGARDLYLDSCTVRDDNVNGSTNKDRDSKSGLWKIEHADDSKKTRGDPIEYGDEVFISNQYSVGSTQMGRLMVKGDLQGTTCGNGYYHAHADSNHSSTYPTRSRWKILRGLTPVSYSLACNSFGMISGMMRTAYGGYCGDNFLGCTFSDGEIITNTEIPANPTFDNKSFKFEGVFTPLVTGQYTFIISSDDASFVYVDGGEYSNRQVVDNGGLHGTQQKQGDITLLANVPYSVTYYFAEKTGGHYFKAWWENGNTWNDGAHNMCTHMTSPAPPTGSFACISCAVGKYTSSTAQMSCSVCESGKYLSLTGQSSCIGCAAGKFFRQSLMTYLPDPVAYIYSDGPSAETACQQAGYNRLCRRDELPDQLLEINGAYARCAAGWVTNPNGRSYWVNYKNHWCGNGPGYHDWGSTGNAGAYCCSPQKVKETVCISCAIGKYTSSTAQLSCIACESGKYLSLSGQSSCIGCPTGNVGHAGGGDQYIIESPMNTCGVFQPATKSSLQDAVNNWCSMSLVNPVDSTRDYSSIKSPASTSPGYCVDANNTDVNDGQHSLNAGDMSTPQGEARCLELCRNYPGATACEIHNTACSVHTSPAVAKGNGDSAHTCRVFHRVFRTMYSTPAIA